MYMEICTQVFIVIHGIFHYMYSKGARIMHLKAGRRLEKLEPRSVPRGRCRDPAAVGRSASGGWVLRVCGS